MNEMRRLLNSLDQVLSENSAEVRETRRLSPHTDWPDGDPEYDKREFLRKEMEYELADEEPERNRGRWGIFVDGRRIKSMEFSSRDSAMRAGSKVAAKSWNKGKRVTIGRIG